MLWIWPWKGSARKALTEKKIKWEKIMTLNTSASNSKSTTSMSFMCKQIWFPPLFLTAKGSICVRATLEKVGELLEIFSSYSGDLFASTITQLTRTWATCLGWLWHSCRLKPSSTLQGERCLGRAVLPCPLRRGHRGCGMLTALQPVVLEGGWQGGFTACGDKVQLSLYSCVQARSVLPL